MAFVHVRSFSKKPTGAPEGGPSLSIQNVLFGIPFGIGCYFLGNPIFAIITTLIMLGGIDEFYTLSEKKGGHPNRIFGFIITLLIAVSYLRSWSATPETTSYSSRVKNQDRGSDFSFGAQNPLPNQGGIGTPRSHSLIKGG